MKKVLALAVCCMIIGGLVGCQTTQTSTTKSTPAVTKSAPAKFVPTKADPGRVEGGIVVPSKPVKK